MRIPNRGFQVPQFAILRVPGRQFVIRYFLFLTAQLPPVVRSIPEMLEFSLAFR